MRHAVVLRAAEHETTGRGLVAARPPSAADGRGNPLPQHGLAVQRKVSSRGDIQVARQRIQVGMTHADQTVTIDLGDTRLRVTDQHGELLATVPRHGRGEISRFKGYGRRHAVNGPAGGR